MTRERPPVQVPATPDTTRGDWSRKSDLAPDRQFIRYLEAHRGLARRPWSEWKAMLKPRAGGTVAKFRERLAALGAKRPAFEPIGFLGAKPRAAAGAFAAVRSILRDRLPGLRTFKDLARAVAAGEPARAG
jgi:hypothetical protein